VADCALREDPFVGPLALRPGERVPEDAFWLAVGEDRIELRPPGEHGRAGVLADFPPDRGAGSSARSPLVRGFGPRIEQILDLTAGLGGDAYRLASAGYEVSGFERHPVVHALLASGWRAACASGAVPTEIASRLDFRLADGRQALEAASGLDLGVYIDPMYPPPRRASAKPRRALQVLRSLLSEDLDAGALVDAARRVAARVVVKRPHHGEPLRPDPDFVLRSKLVRFDVYAEPARMSARSR
jgi:16S rRNA (guanine1516-N2)-methyltransferase